MYREMQKQKAYLEKEIQKSQTELKHLAPGTLLIYPNNTAKRWYVKENGKPRYYLSQKEIHKAQKLATRSILESKLDYMEKELKATNMYLRYAVSDESLEKINELKREYYALVPTANFSPFYLEEKWMKEEFSSNPYFRENLKHSSASGHVLRSKTEAKIDTELFYRHIPFRYECQLRIGHEIVYPDFTFYKARTNEFRYWEHCGMMDDKKYREANLKKMNLYTANGYYPDIDVYYTYETDDEPLSYEKIESVINEITTWLER